MTVYYKLPFDYPKVTWDVGQVPGDYTAASEWQKQYNVGGTAGQVLYAYRALSGGTPLMEWKYSFANSDLGQYEHPEDWAVPKAAAPTSGCFIATAAYGTPLHQDLDVLRRFRDRVLPDDLVNFYYRHSPRLARAISRHDAVRWAVRQPFKVIVWLLRLIGI